MWSSWTRRGGQDVTHGHVVEAVFGFGSSFPRVNLRSLEASRHTAELIRDAGGKRAAFVLNAVPSRGARAQEAREALEAMLPVSPVEMHHWLLDSDALE